MQVFFSRLVKNVFILFLQMSGDILSLQGKAVSLFFNCGRMKDNYLFKYGDRSTYEQVEKIYLRFSFTENGLFCSCFRTFYSGAERGAEICLLR